MEHEISKTSDRKYYEIIYGKLDTYHLLLNYYFLNTWHSAWLTAGTQYNIE